MTDESIANVLTPYELAEFLAFLRQRCHDVMVAASWDYGGLGSAVTPDAVERPRLLPALDKAQVERFADEAHNLWLDTQGGRYNAPTPDPAQVAEMGRLLLEAIHGTPITLSGEQRRSVMHVNNRIIGTHHGSVLQAGTVEGDVHLHPSGDASDTLRNPVLASTEIHPGACRADIVVDADPPRAVAPSGSLYIVTLQARTTRAVILRAARVVISARHRPRRACYTPHILGTMDARKFTADFDADPSMMHPEGPDFPLTISAVDPEQISVRALTNRDEIAWHLEIDWTCLEHKGTTVINNNGHPFETYPHGVITETHCNPIEHTSDCPTRRMPARAKRSPFGPVDTTP